jgi:plastocyanin domain-containing protein
MKNLFLSAALVLVSLSQVHAKDSNLKVNLSVTDKGFEPNKIDVAPDQNVILNITRKTNETCATKIQIPSLKIKKDLPLNKMVSIDLGKLKKGEIRFGCGMNMMESGIIDVK